MLVTPCSAGQVGVVTITQWTGGWWGGGGWTRKWTSSLQADYGREYENWNSFEAMQWRCTRPMAGAGSLDVLSSTLLMPSPAGYLRTVSFLKIPLASCTDKAWHQAHFEGENPQWACYLSLPLLASLVAQMVKRLPAMRETQDRSLGWEDPWRRKWQPTPVLLPGKFHEPRSLVGYSPWGRKELDKTERLHFT